MSDYHANHPDIDPQLPDELRQCESMMARVSLPPSQLPRDELMYRAGWAAAQAHSAAPPTHERGRSFQPSDWRSTLAWSLASSVVAASLAVVATLHFQVPTAPLGKAVVELPAADPAVPKAAEATAPLEDRSPITHELDRRTGRDWTGALLIMRDRALLEQWDHPWIVADSAYGASSSGDGAPSRPKTSRELLQEFLPGTSNVGS